jgi:23S rRNA U2552 (ribose-2'-O)-methylase RlmE/FtsJ
MIDTLSFERYREGSPWVAYRQFCQHFLAPLVLMSRRDVRLLELMRVHLDGIPLDLATSLLPTRSFLNRGIYMHVRLHARYQRNSEGAASAKADEEAKAPQSRTLSKQAVTNLVEDLRNLVRSLDWAPKGTEWAEYYSGDSYERDSLEHKQTLVRDYLKQIAPDCVWDLGANTGVYSRLAADVCNRVVSFDIDPACVERNFLEIKKEKEQRILPQLLDLVNPSPALGWAHDERASLAQRAEADVVLALALIHHIAISNNVPLAKVAAYLAELAPNLVIEFVPKSDPKVKTLLATREDIFPSYTREGFEAAFQEHFEIVKATDIAGSERTLYRMRRRT